MPYPKPEHPADPNKFYGHSPNAEGKGNWQSLFDHIHGDTPTQREPGVALLAKEYARFFGMEERAFLAGLLHDLGKYSPTFTAHLNGAHRKLDHWTAGAWAAVKEFGAADIALAIEGHHIGLQKGTKTSLARLRLIHPQITVEKDLQLTEANDPDASLLLTRWKQDLNDHSIACPVPMPHFLEGNTNQASEMVSVRMLFSALVDADFLDTERHFSIGKNNHIPRPIAPALKAEVALTRLRAYIDDLAKKSDATPEIKELRRRLGDDCVNAAKTDFLLYTLTAPTGIGKTLAMLLFALERAAREPERFRRIVVVLPYLSILDQTAKIYRDLFLEDTFGKHYVLEHHSLAGTTRSDDADGKAVDTGKESQAGEDAARNEARMLTENWESPVILTTNVQLFESLHANRPSACRKLHNLAGSILLCDEVQTLPADMALPTLRTLSALATPKYNTAVVFATATQPAFTMFHEAVARDTGTTGWKPYEIVADCETMFKAAAALRPTRIDWTHAKQATPWVTVADWLTEVNQGLAIVNMRRHSVELARLLRAKNTPGLEYVSTYLCPAHRREVLDRVNKALDRNQPQPCRLVATQCVEAGVDLDFPFGCRALAPLEAIAQAAGRVNRNGKCENGGVLRVFLPDDFPEEKIYPDPTYRQAAQKTKGMIRGEDGPDITDPEVFHHYFRALYAINDLANTEDELTRAISRLDFEETSRRYRLIDQEGINVVVPYGEKGRQVWNEVKTKGLNRERIRAAREFTVSLFVNSKKLPSGLTQLIVAKTKEPAPDWFVLDDLSGYDAVFGLAPSDFEKEQKA